MNVEVRFMHVLVSQSLQSFVELIIQQHCDKFEQNIHTVRAFISCAGDISVIRLTALGSGFHLTVQENGDDIGHVLDTALEKLMVTVSRKIERTRNRRMRHSRILCPAFIPHMMASQSYSK